MMETSQHQPISFLPYPKGPLRWLLRLPLTLYKAGFAPLLGGLPFMVVTTRGRRSGQPRFVFLEYRRHGSKYYVISGWGARPHWYTNLMAHPVATLQIGSRLVRARATPVTDSAEVLRAVYMFRRNNPLGDTILARLSTADTIDLKTLTQVAEEFTVMRFDLEPEKPAELPGIPVKYPWVAPLTGLITSLALLLLLRGKNGPDDS